REPSTHGDEKTAKRQKLAAAPPCAEAGEKITGENRHEETDDRREDERQHGDLVAVRLENALDAQSEVETSENRHEEDEHGNVTDDDRENGFQHWTVWMTKAVRIATGLCAKRLKVSFKAADRDRRGHQSE